jgi:hypothetical protein
VQNIDYEEARKGKDGQRRHATSVLFRLRTDLLRFFNAHVRYRDEDVDDMRKSSIDPFLMAA